MYVEDNIIALTDETESYISVENEYIPQVVFELFKERAKDTFNFID